MERGWHHTTYSGPERPRLGQQPYDRGRGVSADRRGCFECGHEGHISKYCPKLGRHHDSGRFMDRSSGGGNGRWSHDSWSSSRAVMGKEYSYSRSENMRESSHRRSHFDYHGNGDQRPRDSGTSCSMPFRERNLGTEGYRRGVDPVRHEVDVDCHGKQSEPDQRGLDPDSIKKDNVIQHPPENVDSSGLGIPVKLRDPGKDGDDTKMDGSREGSVDRTLDRNCHSIHHQRPDEHGVSPDKVREEESIQQPLENVDSSCLGVTMEVQNPSKDKDNSHTDGSREGSVDRTSDRHGHSRNHEMPDQHGVDPDKIREEDFIELPPENVERSCFEMPMKARNPSKDRDKMHMDGSREGSVDRTSDRNGYSRSHERTNLKEASRCCDGGYDKVGGRSSLANYPDSWSGDHNRELRGWGSDWRHSRHWEAYPGHSQYLPGSYISVCNARFLQQRRRSRMLVSPPSSQAVGSFDPFLPSSQIEEVNNGVIEVQSRGWLCHDSQGNLRGPMALAQLKELVDRGQLQPDYLVQHEGSNEWVALEHAWSALDVNIVQSSLELTKHTVRSPEMPLVCPQLSQPTGQKLVQEEQYNLDGADQDICPPGTEACVLGLINENYEDFHIDERVEKLMEGITLIPGKEKEVVHEALSSAARRVQQEYELDIAVEESPRSHGGFADLGDQWKDGDFGSDVQGLEAFAYDQQAAKIDAKVDEAGAEAGSDCGTEDVSVPKPTSALVSQSESNQEPWKWPSRGGDWKVVYVMDNSQPPRWEAQGSSEKGYAGYPRKVVMNEGMPICAGKNPNLHDPRRQNQVSGRANVAESSRLLVPKFAHRALVLNVENASQDHNQQSVTTPIGANSTTPKSRGSTPHAHVSTPVKGRSFSAGLGGGLKMDKPGKISSSQGLVTGTVSKSLCQMKQQQSLNKGVKNSNLLPPAKRKFAMVDKRVSPPLLACPLDSQLKTGSEYSVENFDMKSKQLLVDGLNHPSPVNVQPDKFDSELSKDVNAPPLKKMILSRILPFKEDLKSKEEGQWYYLDGAGHEVGHFNKTSEMNLVSGCARSPDGYTCLLTAEVETLINDAVEYSEITHHGPSGGVKHIKLNNGETIIKSNGVNGSTKAVKRENGNSISRSRLKRKTLAGSSHRRYEKGAYRMLKPGQRALADKNCSSAKVEHFSKNMTSSTFEGDRGFLDKEMATILRLMMEADTNKCFQSANILASDGKGLTSFSGKILDLTMIEKKLRGGAYGGGKDGFRAFKEDVNRLTRIGFRDEKDRETFSTAEKLFKLAHHYFALVESQISGTSLPDPHIHGKLPGARAFHKVGKGRMKNLSLLQHRPRNKRKAWDDDGKVKYRLSKKGRQGDSSTGDVDSNSDSTELDLQRLSKLKKERSWESEGDSSEDEEPGFMEEDEEETETEPSDSDVPSESEGEDGIFDDENYHSEDEQVGYLGWGARMTKAAMVPPVTRKYVVIEEYRVVADKERVEQKMKVELPRDYEEKVQAAQSKRGDSYSHLDIPEVKDYRPRKKLGEEVLEQEVYGIDPYTHNLLWDTMPDEISGFSEIQKQQFIEERLLLALNKDARQYTGTGKAPMEYSLETIVERISTEALIDKEWALQDFSEQLLKNMRNRPKDKFVAYRKGLGVVCNKSNGLEKDEFVVEFFGEVYPPWRWYEKQDGIRSLQKKDKDTTPEFYNIFYERPKGDAAGYDLLVVDAMHKANFASRLCHSCRPNCEAKITAVNNTYIIGVYTLKPIKRGEELTFDYNSVTESKEEYNNAVCLCGSQGCRGSYLNLTGSGTFEEVIMNHHGLLDRHRLLLDSCLAGSVTDGEWQEMRQAGLGSCLLSGLPAWLLKYAARLVHFMNYEKIHLPAELLKDFDLKRKKGIIEGCTELDAEITTEGVYNQRLQNLAITLDKVRHILTKLYRNPSLAPPPLRRLEQKDMVQWIWKRDDSVVSEMLQCLEPHLPKDALLDFRQRISIHGPDDSGANLRQCLLWLRDELRKLPATCKARHDAAADVIHLYAYTKCFFTMEDYAVVESGPMNIHPLDLGSSRHSISGPRVWHKTYSKEYVWGQLINWYKQNVADPGASLAKASRGCLTLPDVSSCYAKSMQHDFRQGYGQRHREKMIWHMEEKPQQKWPKSKFWSEFWCFKNERYLFGSPMLDCVIEGRPLDDQMLEWLKLREDVFIGPWDEQ